MRLYCTKKLLEKIKGLSFISNKSSQENGWYAKVFYQDRIQYIAALDSRTLATVIFPGKGINSIEKLEKALRQSIQQLFKRRGWSSLLGQQVSFDSDGIEIAVNSNRRLMGSLNEMIRLASYDILNSASLDRAIDNINEAPMSFINMKAPAWLLDDFIKEKADKSFP